MDYSGSQMRSYPNPGEPVSQRPHSQPQQQNNAQSKPPAGPPPKTHPNGCADVKPRLTKEQHDILETEFQRQHKPSTATKKGFAEALGVPIDKINNWFQNRRAKVKQDIKKQQNQCLGFYQGQAMPMVSSQYPLHHVGQPQPQPPMSMSMAKDFYTTNADISPSCLPVQGMEGPSALELGPQMAHHQSYVDMHPLQSIPEANRTNSFHPAAVMESFMAATAGASFIHNNAASLPPHDSNFPYDTTGLPNAFPTDLGLAIPHQMPNETTTNGMFEGFSDFSVEPFTVQPAEPQHSNDSMSNEPSPFSGAQSATTPQSSNGPNTSSVQSVQSAYHNWTGDQKPQSDLQHSNDNDDPFDQPYGLPQASASDHALFSWQPNGQSAAYSQGEMYQHPNASAQAMLSSPGQSDYKANLGQLDLDAPPAFGGDAYSRRNSSTTNLATNIEAIHIQNGHTPDGFRQPSQPTSIAARRQKRPTALNPSTFRSASYTSGMPSPGGNSEHTLRRIRSTGIPNAGGRVQKSTPSSAQRSPLTMTFSEAAASPKFARTFSMSSNTTNGQGGSLAPPTPLTPNEFGGRFPSWQSSTVIRNHQPMPEHSSPESLNVNWSSEPQSAGLFSNTGSPPSTPLDVGQLNQARLNNDSLYRDTPPQSAPATQQTFPRTAYPPSQMRHAYRQANFSTNDLSIAQPKPSHFRRPSLPAEGHDPLGDSDDQFDAPFGSIYDARFDDMSLNGIHNIPFAPPPVMPEFLVQEYAPPHVGMGMRRTAEPQQKSYIFANQGPGDFRN